MRNSMDSGFNEIKDVKARRSIREGSEEVTFSGIQNRLKLNNNEDRSNSEPPRSFGTYLPSATGRLKPIREKNREDGQGSSDEDEFSKSNESDFELEMPDSVSQTPTPTPLTASNARRINSETNLNDTKRRMSGFMGNRSKRFCASTSELSFSSHLDTRKSLFSPKNNALSRQSFNSSLYGSNMSLSSTNSRLFMVNSPFYNGKTMFGGASAYPKRDINQHKILRTPVQMRPSSSLSNSSNTSTKSDKIVPESNAAKRILEIMNQFSGPLKEARVMGNNINSIIKIPSLVQDKQRYGESDLNLDRSIALSTPATPYGRPLTANSKTRPESPCPSILKPLQIPTMSQLLQMKRLQNNTEKVREIASRSDSFLNQNHEYKLPTGDDSQNSTQATSLKMKSNITKNLLRNDKQLTNEPAIPVNLPNIQLPEMRGIPKFDIPIQAKTTVPTPTPVVKAVEKPVVVPTVQFKFQETKKSEFVLSKPIPVEVEDVGNLVAVNDKFSFTKPLPIDNVQEVPKPIIEKSPVKSTSDNLFASLVAKQKSSSWECNSCFARNDSEKTKCLCCDNSKPGSGAPSKANSKNLSQNDSGIASQPPADDLFKSLAAQQKKTQWECDTCMCKNDISKDKCVSCETPKPGSKPSQPPAAAPTPKFSFGMPATTPSDDLFKSLAAKQKTESWECDGCFSKNDKDKEKCACCEAPKPGSKPSQPAPATQSFSFGMKPATTTSFSFGMKNSDEGFKKIVEKQSAGWECTACMTKNDNSKTKCVCCEQSKPGTNEAAPYFSFSSSLKSSATVPLPAVSEVKFSFGMPGAIGGTPATSGVVPATPVVTPATPVVTPGSSAVTPATALVTPGSSLVTSASSLVSPVTSTMTPATLAPTSEKKTDPKDEVDKPKPTFSFGMPLAKPADDTTKTAPVTATPGFSFKAPTTTSKTSEKENLTEKPAMFTFGAVAKDTPAPVTTSTTQEKSQEVKPAFGGFKFSADPPKLPEPAKPAEPEPEVKSTPSFGSLNKNGGFSFGGFTSKPAEPEPVKPAAPGGFAFGGASMSFGAVTTAPASTTSNTFVFGGSKTENEQPKTFGSFGMSTEPAKPSFAAPAAQPTFPQTNNAFSFTAKKEEPAAAPASSVFAFGAKPAEPANSAPMLFGNNQATVPQVTPMFGANTFGAPTNNNNTEFGSKMPSFGNQPQKRAFEFTSSSADVSQSKKFDFGGQQQANSAPFQFNSGSENKPAFNFTATATPSFNFTNPNANNPQAPSSAPVMQFGAGAQAPQIAIPGITSFSAQGTGSAANANQRKILRARRTTRR